MKIVLLDNVKGIGHVGDVKVVSDGYARNFLLPRKLASIVTEGVMRDVEAIKVKKLVALTLAQDIAKKVAEKISGSRIEMTARANEKGKLFASIEASHVATAISKLASVRIDTDAISMPEHIKTVGEHTLSVKIHDDISADFIVAVTALN